MKKRIFYVINLDRSRILTLAAFFSGFLLLSFITGFYLGHLSGGPQGGIQSDDPFSELIPPPHSGNPELSMNSEEAESGPSSRESTPPPRTTTPEVKGIPLRSLAEPVVQEEKSSSTTRSIEKQTEKKSDRKENETKPSKNETPLLRKKPSLKLANVSDSPEPEKKREPAKPAGATKRVYAFQLGAFTTESAANRMLETLKQEGLKPYQVSGAGKKFVRVGKGSSRSDLGGIEKKLKEKNHNYFLVVD